MNLPFKIALLSSGVETLTKLAAITRIERTRLSRALNGWTTLEPSEKDNIAEALGRPRAELFPEDRHGALGDA